MPEKIKVCYIIGSFQAGGAENLVLTILKNLDRDKYDPFIVVRMKEGVFLEDYKALDIPIASFPYLGYFSFLKSVLSLARFIKKNKISVLHIHLVGMFVFATLASLLAGKNKRIIHWHNTYPVSRNRKAAQVRFGSRMAHTIIAISETMKEENCRIYKVDPHKVETIHNALNLDLIMPSGKESEAIVGSIGSFTEQKNFSTLIRAFFEVHQARPDITLEIIGDGPQRGELQQLVHELDLKHHVRFLGILPTQQVLSHLDKWRVFTLSSKWEGLPIALLEAMAMARPVVATNVDAIPEIVQDAETGYLCEVENTSEIAEKLLLLLNDPEKALKFGLEGRTRITQLYRLDRMMERLEALYAKQH